MVMAQEDAVVAPMVSLAVQVAPAGLNLNKGNYMCNIIS